jgi:hypothetical protein
LAFEYFGNGQLYAIYRCTAAAIYFDAFVKVHLI